MSELVATVSPSAQLGADEALTRTTANAMAVPEVEISGVAGSGSIDNGAVTTAKIADGAVTPVKLNASVVQAGGGLALDSSNGLSIADDAVTPARFKHNFATLANYPGSVSLIYPGLSSGKKVILYSTVGGVTYHYIKLMVAGTKPAKRGQKFVVMVVQDSGHTVTWLINQGAIRWAGGTAPVLTPGALRRDIFEFVWDGQYAYGLATQNYPAT